jgi:hypothetical protein
MAGRPRSTPSRPGFAQFRVQGTEEPVDITILKKALHRPTADDVVNVLWRIGQDDSRGGEQLGALRLLAEIQGLIGRAAMLHLHAQLSAEQQLSDEEINAMLDRARTPRFLREPQTENDGNEVG